MVGSDDDDDERVLTKRRGAVGRKRRRRRSDGAPLVVVDDSDDDSDSCSNEDKECKERWREQQYAPQQQPYGTGVKDDDVLVDTSSEGDGETDNNGGIALDDPWSDLHGAILETLNDQPPERWHAARARARRLSPPPSTTPPNLTASTTNNTSTTTTHPFASLPDTCLLRILSHLDLHEMDNLLHIDRTMTSSCRRHRHRDASILQIQMDVTIRYFSLLKPYTDSVSNVVDGGWTVLIQLLTEVSRRLQSLYGPVRPPLLHRALLGEKVVGNLIGRNPIFPWPSSSSVKGMDLQEEKEVGEEEKASNQQTCRRKVRPSWSLCVDGPTLASLGCDPQYGDNVLLGDIIDASSSFPGDDEHADDVNNRWKKELRARFVSWKKKLGARDNHKGDHPVVDELDQDGVDRVRMNLLPMVWMFETTTHPTTLTNLFAGGAGIASSSVDDCTTTKKCRFGITVPSRSCQRLGTDVLLWQDEETGASSSSLSKDSSGGGGWIEFDRDAIAELCNQNDDDSKNATITTASSTTITSSSSLALCGSPLPSPSAFFCLCPAAYTTACLSSSLGGLLPSSSRTSSPRKRLPLADREINAFAFLVAHKIPPFDFSTEGSERRCRWKEHIRAVAAAAAAAAREHDGEKNNGNDDDDGGKGNISSSSESGRERRDNGGGEDMLLSRHHRLSERTIKFAIAALEGDSMPLGKSTDYL